MRDLQAPDLQPPTNRKARDGQPLGMPHFVPPHDSIQETSQGFPLGYVEIHLITAKYVWR